MARILAHPFRFGRTGVETVEQDSDAGNAQQLVITIGTRRHERHLAPLFGITDPAFADVDAAELAAVVDVYGPPVTITDVTTTYPGDGSTATAVVTFD